MSRNLAMKRLAAGASACALAALGAFSVQNPKFAAKKQQIYAWGQGAFGRLGLGSDTNQFDPKVVSALENIEIKELRTGKTITACIDNEGQLWTWGKPINGLLGLGGEEYSFSRYEPQLVEKTVGLKLKQVSVGNNHIMALTEDGEVYSWGSSDNYKLGHSHLEKSNRELKDRRTIRSHGILVVSTPKKIDDLKDVKQVEAGLQYSLFVMKDGSVQVIGSSLKGAVGLGDDNTAATKLTIIDKLKGININKVVAGSDFTVALDDTGTLHSWGFNNYGQLGNTSQLTNAVPKPIKVSGQTKVTDVSCGDNFCLALTEAGGVLSWGCGSSGQLGQGNTMDLSAPKPIKLDFKVKGIACGEAHSAIISEDGKLYTFGSGREGQIGRGNHVESSASNRLSPVQVDALEGKQIDKVTCGGSQTFAFVSEKNTN